jgi:hypothetical protein
MTAKHAGRASWRRRLAYTQVSHGFDSLAPYYRKDHNDLVDLRRLISAAARVRFPGGPLQKDEIARGANSPSLGVGRYGDLVSLIRRPFRVRLTATPPRGARSLGEHRRDEPEQVGSIPTLRKTSRWRNRHTRRSQKPGPKGCEGSSPSLDTMPPWRNGIRARLRTWAPNGV